jgi:beta-aspartyl-peptidase (threonine type)
MTLNPYALVIHGGAGPKLGRDYSLVERHIEKLLEEGRRLLERGDRAVDVVEQLVRQMEASGYYVAGKGSAENRAGYVELDAAIMDGKTRAAGGVAALRDIVHPISAARQVMDRTPHVLLVGAGATNFALKMGLQSVENPAAYYQPAVGVLAEEQSSGELSHGTVGAVALDTSGGLASATSTGGVFGKLEGRVGDTPLIGAGTWADENVAVSCTGTGEFFVRAGGARDVAARVVYQGAGLEEAAAAFIADVGRLGGDGGAIAVSRTGKIAMVFNSAGMKRGSIASGQPAFVATF